MTIQCPACAHRFTLEDKRTVKWRYRIRLYRKGQDEPEADTDPELEPTEHGTTIAHGLPAMAQELLMMVFQFHMPAVVEDISELELARRLTAFRPTLSRRGGNGVWRIPYTVLRVMGGPDGKNQNRQEWLARVDVTKEPEETSA